MLLEEIGVYFPRLKVNLEDRNSLVYKNSSSNNNIFLENNTILPDIF
jgi:hypothetical protein